MNNTTRVNRDAYSPLTDIYEMEDLFSLKMEMPGISKSDMEIEIDDDVLKISGKSAEDVSSGDLKYSEYTSKDFYRSFKIGRGIDRSRIEANLENGVLTLILHKSEKAKPKKITIN